MSRVSNTASILIVINIVSAGLGILRDTVIAAVFGASVTSDIFFSAFTLLNILYQVLITGTLVPAFLPVFSEALAHKTREDAWVIASSSINILTVALTTIALLLFVSSDIVAKFFAPGFSPESSAQVAFLLRIFSPGIILLGLSGLASAQLNSLDTFAVPALGIGFVNLGILLSILTLGSQWGVIGLSLGAMLGMFGQLALQLILLKPRINYRFVFDFNHPGVKRIVQLTLPLIFYLAIAQSATIIERIFASTLPIGTVSWLNYAQKITTLPNTLFAGAILVALFPALSKAISNSLHGTFREQLWNGIRTIFFLTLPSSIFLAVASQNIVEILYERGQFSFNDTQFTSALVAIYAIGITPTALGITFVRAFHARQNMKTPLWVGIINTTIYACLAAILSNALGMVGLALSLALAAISSAIILGIQLDRDIRFLDWKPVTDLIKITLAGITGAIVFVVLNNFPPMHTESTSLLFQILALAIKFVVSGLIYLSVCVFLNAEPARWYWQSTSSILHASTVKWFAKIWRANERK